MIGRAAKCDETIFENRWLMENNAQQAWSVNYEESPMLARQNSSRPKSILPDGLYCSSLRSRLPVKTRSLKAEL